MEQQFSDPAIYLPFVFAALMGISILVYVCLDGFDLGIGTLFAIAPDEHKDKMVHTIGPFWDANETWLVLAVGLLLVAFPIAHGTILTALYIPVAVMLIGLILRGVAFDFRAKAPEVRKPWWNLAFMTGSAMTGIAQGYMLGIYVLGLDQGPGSIAFGVLTGLCLVAAYVYIGAAWLILKTEGALQRIAVRWARGALVLTMLGMAAISLATPLASPRIFEKWFSIPAIVALAPLPLMTGGVFVLLWIMLRHLPAEEDRWAWVPFVGGVAIFCLGFAGLS